MMHNWDGTWSAANWLAMSALMLVFWSVVVAGIVAVVRSSRGAHPRTDLAAGQILDQRFARGELTEQEFLRRRDLLRGSGEARAQTADS